MVIYEDNAACIAQLKGGYIKGDRTNHISQKFLYTHELQQNKIFDIKQIRSTYDFANMFTKALTTSTFEKITYIFGMHCLNKDY